MATKTIKWTGSEGWAAELIKHPDPDNEGEHYSPNVEAGNTYELPAAVAESFVRTNAHWEAVGWDPSESMKVEEIRERIGDFSDAELDELDADDRVTVKKMVEAERERRAAEAELQEGVNGGS